MCRDGKHEVLMFPHWCRPRWWRCRGTTRQCRLCCGATVRKFAVHHGTTRSAYGTLRREEWRRRWWETHRQSVWLNGSSFTKEGRDSWLCVPWVLPLWRCVGRVLTIIKWSVCQGKLNDFEKWNEFTYFFFFCLNWYKPKWWIFFISTDRQQSV